MKNEIEIHHSLATWVINKKIRERDTVIILVFKTYLRKIAVSHSKNDYLKYIKKKKIFEILHDVIS